MSSLSQTFAFNSPLLYYITDIYAVKLQSSGLCGNAKSGLKDPVVWYHIIVQRNPHEAGRLWILPHVVQDLTHSGYSMRTKTHNIELLQWWPFYAFAHFIHFVCSALTFWKIRMCIFLAFNMLDTWFYMRLRDLVVYCQVFWCQEVLVAGCNKYTDTIRHTHTQMAYVLLMICES